MSKHLVDWDLETRSTLQSEARGNGQKDKNQESGSGKE